MNFMPLKRVGLFSGSSAVVIDINLSGDTKCKILVFHSHIQDFHHFFN